MPSDTASSRVLLIGCGTTTLSALESLVEKHSVVGIVRDHDKAAAERDPVCRRAKELRIPMFRDATIRGIERLVDQLNPDVVVVSSFGRILPAKLIAKSKFINVHYSMLPRFRGRANVNWAILNGEPETGISIHVLSPGLDAGNILFQRAVPIRRTDTATTLYAELNEVQREFLGATVQRHLAGHAGKVQDESQATYGCTRLPQDGEIDWTKSTREVFDLIRSQTAPFPGAFTFHSGSQLTIWNAEPVADAPTYEGRVPGRVVRVAKAHGFVDVLTGDGVLRIREVQPAGWSPCPAPDVLNSVKHTLGLSTFDLLERIRTLEASLAEVSNRHCLDAYEEAASV